MQVRVGSGVLEPRAFGDPVRFQNCCATEPRRWQNNGPKCQKGGCRQYSPKTIDLLLENVTFLGKTGPAVLAV